MISASIGWVPVAFEVEDRMPGEKRAPEPTSMWHPPAAAFPAAGSVRDGMWCLVEGGKPDYRQGPRRIQPTERKTMRRGVLSVRPLVFSLMMLGFSTIRGTSPAAAQSAPDSITAAILT